MTAEEVLRNMAAAYAALDSYSDTGEVVSYLGKDDIPNTVRFRTWFARPDRFRFVWSTHHPYPPLWHNVTDWAIWYDGTSSRFWDTRHGTRVEECLEAIVAGATGVSFGSAYRIIEQLLPTAFESPSAFTTAVPDGAITKAAVDGVDCWHLRVKPWWGDSLEIYVGTHDWLLRRVESLRDGRKSTVETRRDLTINSLSVDDPIFTVEPPPLDAE